MIANLRRIGCALGAPARFALIVAIKTYRATLAGLFGGQCRFHPSCSAYAEEAVRGHGALRGSALAAWRILRCSPLSRGGVDPVPSSTGRGPRSVSGSPAYDSIIRQNSEALT